uniref:Uncharacterized protein n=1 Tax=Sander lucioperca TaxID=283035 RepID=A0A8C9ZH36_SANLU
MGQYSVVQPGRLHLRPWFIFNILEKLPNFLLCNSHSATFRTPAGLRPVVCVYILGRDKGTDQSQLTYSHRVDVNY